MGKNNKFTPRPSSGYKRESKNLELRNGRKEPLIVLSFKNLDNNQGQSFENWEEGKLLALAMMKLRSLNEYTLSQALSKEILKIYTKVDFPPNSTFKHPRHVADDVEWCSFHVQGKPCIIGYFEDNIFHIVFLDKEHEFWITEKKRT